MRRVTPGGGYASGTVLVVAALIGAAPSPSGAASTTVYAFNTIPNAVYEVQQGALPVTTTVTSAAGAAVVTLDVSPGDQIVLSLDSSITLQPPPPPFFLALMSNQACAAATWLPSSDPTVVGYVVSYGSRSVALGQAPAYDQSVATAGTTYDICALPPGRYYAAVQARNSAGIKSAYSIERVVEIMTLPVLISIFEARSRDGGVLLTWQVTTDEVVSGYRLYRRDGDSPERRLFDDLLPSDAASFLDTHVRSATRYTYTLAALTSNGDEVLSAPATVTTPAFDVELGQNVPNPFNPTTTIPFTLDASSPVALRVYDVSGALVATLYEGRLGEGRHTAGWNGTDATGRPVSSGTYFYVLTTGKRRLSKRMVLVK